MDSYAKGYISAVRAKERLKQNVSPRSSTEAPAPQPVYRTLQYQQPVVQYMVPAPQPVYRAAQYQQPVVQYVIPAPAPVYGAAPAQRPPAAHIAPAPTPVYRAATPAPRPAYHVTPTIVPEPHGVVYASVEPEQDDEPMYLLAEPAVENKTYSVASTQTETPEPPPKSPEPSIHVEEKDPPAGPPAQKEVPRDMRFWDFV